MFLLKAVHSFLELSSPTDDLLKLTLQTRGLLSFRGGWGGLGCFPTKKVKDTHIYLVCTFNKCIRSKRKHARFLTH